MRRNHKGIATYTLTLGVYYYQAPNEFLAVTGGDTEGMDALLIRPIEVIEGN